MSDDTIKFPTKSTKSAPTLDYTKWVAEGYLYIINRALTVIANDPNPEDGKYCIEIGFKTGFPGVVAPDWVIKDQPNLKIILNNQFFNLVVKDASFSVTLFFGGKKVTLTIPFAAVVWFHDDNGFTLSFEYPIEKEPELVIQTDTEKPEETTAVIVSLDAFRSKTDDEGDA